MDLKGLRGVRGLWGSEETEGGCACAKGMAGLRGWRGPAGSTEGSGTAALPALGSNSRASTFATAALKTLRRAGE